MKELADILEDLKSLSRITSQLLTAVQSQVELIREKKALSVSVHMTAQPTDVRKSSCT